MNGKNICLTLTATKWATVEDKKKFIAHFERFVKSGYKRSLFYKWFYTRLSMMFGFIAHYNLEGFYSEKFSTPQRIEQFKTSIREFPCYGDPAYTFSDVEKIIRARINYIP